MATKTELQDLVYRMVGEEVAAKDFHPGPMARAVQDAQGRNEMIQSLYIKFRYEELLRQIEREREIETPKGTLECPGCGYRGIPVKKARGNGVLCVLLFFLYVIPGIIYLALYEGYKGVCGRCGKTLVDKI